MAGNKNSGRRPRKLEDRKRLSRLYPTAITALEEALTSNITTMDAKLRAAIEVIRQVIGMPRQQTDIQAIIGVCSLGDRLAQGQIERAKNEAALLMEGINGQSVTEGEDQGESEALQE